MSSEDQKKGYSRRGFLKGSAIAALGVAAGGMGLLGGCSKGGDDESKNGSTARKYDKISEQVTTDIVVVGAGASGLCASVQAAELGAKVVLLEASGSFGGNAIGTEGIFAVGSDMQKKAGIQLTLHDIIAKEQEFFNYRVNALIWNDMAKNSADNITWLANNGVKFSGKVNDYAPLGKMPVFHWFDGKATPCYTEPLAKKVKELGVDIRMKTKGMDLIMEGGRVAGIYAVKSNGDVIKISCKAAIMASGGFGGNKEILKTRFGYNTNRMTNLNTLEHNGDGIRMATSVGGRDLTEKCAFLGGPMLKDTGILNPFSLFLTAMEMQLLWVNENGERFADENCVAIQPGCAANAMYNQKEVFGIFDQEIIDALPPIFKQDFEGIFAKNNSDLIKADTIEEIAKTFGIPTETFVENFNRYTKYCKQGLDEDFGKPAAVMKELKAPFYAIHFQPGIGPSIGGIFTNRNAEALTADKTPIPGLYGVGVEGCMLYGETYTFSVPGSCNANNVNSGRTAAKHAVATVLKA